MKYLKICFIAIIVSCNSPKKKAPDMPGTYLMVSQTVTAGSQETKYSDLKQLKIYTDKYVMYTQVLASDSVSLFGVGSYTSDTSGVTENIIYTSSNSTFNDSLRSYKLSITKTPDGYNQVIPNIVIDSTKSKLTETYQKVGTPQTTPLDGVWKQTKSYELKGTDTMWYNRTEYKAFNNGYFMFGLTDKDSSGKITTGIGFGTFSMNGDNQIKETDLNSTYAIIAGQTFMVNFQLNGNDNYQQTITHPDSSKTVEFYERLKL
ncbi:MAG TPA: hypothetical protein VLS85_02060 [Hanamia sp.]|nr:hypothetical protein [Hanamia sp.]